MELRSIQLLINYKYDTALLLVIKPHSGKIIIINRLVFLLLSYKVA